MLWAALVQYGSFTDGGEKQNSAAKPGITRKRFASARAQALSGYTGFVAQDIEAGIAVLRSLRLTGWHQACAYH